MHKYKEYLIEKEKRIKEDNAKYFDSVNDRLQKFSNKLAADLKK